MDTREFDAHFRAFCYFAFFSTVIGHVSAVLLWWPSATAGWNEVGDSVIQLLLLQRYQRCTDWCARYCGYCLRLSVLWVPAYDNSTILLRPYAWGSIDCSVHLRNYCSISQLVANGEAYWQLECGSVFSCVETFLLRYHLGLIYSVHGENTFIPHRMPMQLKKQRIFWCAVKIKFALRIFWRCEFH